MLSHDFKLPHYPLPSQFSDPYNDWMYDPFPGSVIGRPASELDVHTLYCLFNGGWLPAGNFEEMAAYVPRVLELLLQEPPADFSDELLEYLLNWCHMEHEAMSRDPQFLAGMQEAFMYLFKRWTQEANPRYAEHIEHLLRRGDFNALFHESAIPWLSSEHFLPHLLALDSVPHAAWLLFASDEDNICSYPYSAIPLPPATRLAAMNMVEDWLLTSATPEDIDFWDPVVTHAHDYFHRLLSTT